MKLFSRHPAGLVAAAACWFATTLANAEIVANGGFETGNFSGWSVPPSVPNQSLFRVTQFGGPHSGTYYAGIASTQQQFISQILPTVAGTDYELSFWLRKPTIAPGNFIIRWEGETVFSQTILGNEPLLWREYSIPVHANITGSFLEFGQNFFPLEFHIDDISVVAVPAPSAAPLLLMGCAVAACRRRRR